MLSGSAFSGPGISRDAEYPRSSGPRNFRRPALMGRPGVQGRTIMLGPPQAGVLDAMTMAARRVLRTADGPQPEASVSAWPRGRHLPGGGPPQTRATCRRRARYRSAY